MAYFNENVLVQVRIDRDVKIEAEKCLEKCGLTLTEAMRCFVSMVAVKKGLPFSVSLEGLPRVYISKLEHRKRSSEADNSVEKQVAEASDIYY